MNNIQMSIVWWDSDKLNLELGVQVTADDVQAKGKFYVDLKSFIDGADSLYGYCMDPVGEWSFQIGTEQTKPTYFSMQIISVTKTGMVYMEVSMGIEYFDGNRRPCVVLIRLELGALQRFAKRLKRLAELPVCTQISVYDFEE